MEKRVVKQRLIRALLAGLLCVGWAAAAAAQERLTWKDCIQEAMQHNPDFLAAQESVKKAYAQYHGSYSPLFPQLSANAGYTDSKTSSRSQDYSAGFSAKQTIFSGLKNEAGVQKGKADMEAAEANLAAVQAQVAFDLKNGYAELLFEQEQAELAEAIASRRQENVRLIELRFEGGREPKGSFLRSRALYRAADFEVGQAERNLRVAQRQLSRVLGRAELDRIFVEDFQVAPPGDRPDFRVLALETPVRLQAAAQARSAQAGIAVARSELFPDISATGSLGRQGSRWPPERNDWSAGILFSYPFWPGGHNVFDLQAAKAEARRSQQSLRSTEDQTVLGLESAFAGFQDAVQRLGVQRDFVDAALVRAETARGQYSLGLLSFQDWDTIENDLISNQKTMLVNLRQAIIAEAAWEQAQGKGAML